MQCHDRTGVWIQHFRTNGLDGPRDLLQSGKLSNSAPRNEQNNETSVTDTDDTCNTLSTNIPEDKRKLHLAHVKELMRKYGLSSKYADSIHINAASKKFVEGWQKSPDRCILRLKYRNLPLSQGMNRFSYVTELKGADIGLAGTPVTIPYVESHDTVTAYGSLTADGRHPLRTYDRLSAAGILSGNAASCLF